jgi:hypothetical protein
MEYYEKYQGSWYSGRDSNPAASEDKPVVVPKCDPIDKKWYFSSPVIFGSGTGVSVPTVHRVILD